MYFRKKPAVDLPQESTAIWSCTQEDCNGWMRDDFTFQSAPVCHLCHTPMNRSMKMLPILTNKSRSMKQAPKGVSIS